jgi:hypothetical protein
MKAAKLILGSALLSLVSMTGTAMAGSSYPPSPSSTTVVKGAGSGAGSTAFTGGDVSAIGVALAVLAALGLIALIAARFWPERNGGSHFRV